MCAPPGAPARARAAADRHGWWPERGRSFRDRSYHRFALSLRHALFELQAFAPQSDRVAGGGRARARATADTAPAVLAAQIDRIFRDRVYHAPRFGPARWLPDGTAYAIVEAPARRIRDRHLRRGSAARRPCWCHRRVSCRRARQPSRHRRLRVVGRRPAASHLHEHKKVWRQNTRGDYWVLDVDRAR